MKAINQYNHYWMQAIILNGWGVDENNVNYLNLQNVLFNNEPNKPIEINSFLNLSKKTSTKSIFGSYVLTVSTEKNISVDTIENDMLNFIKNNNKALSIEEKNIIKKYFYLQLHRNPFQYQSKKHSLDSLLEIEHNFIENITFLDFKLSNIVFDKSHQNNLFNIKTQSCINNAIINSFDENYYLSKTENKLVAIIDISHYNKFLVIGDFTIFSFSSKIIDNEIENTFLEEFIKSTEINISNPEILYNTYFFPITSQSFVYIYDNQHQLELLNNIINEIIDFYNIIQFTYSSGIILPKNMTNLNLFPNKFFTHNCEKFEVRGVMNNNLNIILNNNLNIILNNNLKQQSSEAYFSNYFNTINNIKLTKIFTEENLHQIKNEIFQTLKNLSLYQVDFVDIKNPEELSFVLENVFSYKSEKYKFIFLFSKDGFVLYSKNNSGFELFCLHYFDFIYRFLIEISIHEPLSFYDILSILSPFIHNGLDSRYKQIFLNLLTLYLEKTLIKIELINQIIKIFNNNLTISKKM